MNVHYVDANDYNLVQYAWIKMSLFEWINCVAAYKEWNALLTATANIWRNICSKIPTVEIPQFFYSSTLC